MQISYLWPFLVDRSFVMCLPERQFYDEERQTEPPAVKPNELQSVINDFADTRDVFEMQPERYSCSLDRFTVSFSSNNQRSVNSHFRDIQQVAVERLDDVITCNLNTLARICDLEIETNFISVYSNCRRRKRNCRLIRFGSSASLKNKLEAERRRRRKRGERKWSN